MAAPLSRRTLPAVLTRIHRVLAAHRTEVDGLNVFPVPDGDTGTNLAHTVRAALEDLGDDDGDKTGEIAIRGAMRGARGNSGVILSQVVRALAETLDDDDPIDGRDFARFLERARKLAYEAVSDPVEGTILTAMTVAAETAARVAERDLAEVLGKVCDDVHLAVARTPEQLEVLRRAGVVDAGARGFELVLDAIHGHVIGEDIDSALPDGPAPRPDVQDGQDDGRDEGGADPLRYAYEVQYLLEADEQHVGELRSRLRELGDSVAVVGSAGLLNVHVHTNDIGPAIEAGVKFGRPSDIEVVAFAEQIGRGEAACTREGASGDAGVAEPTGDERPQLGFVAVLPGPGLRAVAEELGAAVVDGASGALPSVADVLNAVGTVDADRIVILPGHRNVVPTARQASAVSVAEGGRDLHVVSSADSPPAVLSALAVAEPNADPEVVIDDMWAAAGAVRAGEVVGAVRDADTPLGEVRQGQFLALLAGEVIGVHDDPLEALAAVASGDAGEVEPGGIVTLCIGADVDDQERERAVGRLRELFPDAEVETIDGGQRPARYHLGIA